MMLALKQREEVVQLEVNTPPQPRMDPPPARELHNAIERETRGPAISKLKNVFPALESVVAYDRLVSRQELEAAIETKPALSVAELRTQGLVQGVEAYHALGVATEAIVEPSITPEIVQAVMQQEEPSMLVLVDVVSFTTLRSQLGSNGYTSKKADNLNFSGLNSGEKPPQPPSWAIVPQSLLDNEPRFVRNTIGEYASSSAFEKNQKESSEALAGQDDKNRLVDRLPRRTEITDQAIIVGCSLPGETEYVAVMVTPIDKKYSCVELVPRKRPEK